jgi:SAM-dependent methyltransferase
VTESIVDGIVPAYDFSPFGKIVDVGGGVGVLLSRILEVYTATTGILYDTAAVTQKASAYLARRGLSGRVEVIAGDFFAAVPRGDLLVLQAILHDWDDERAALILRQCRKALEPAGRLLIIEDILSGKVGGAMPLIEIDLTMLVCHNGRERTLAEYEELLVREGFRLESVSDTGSGNLIAARTATEKLSRTRLLPLESGAVGQGDISRLTPSARHVWRTSSLTLRISASLSPSAASAG